MGVRAIHARHLLCCSSVVASLGGQPDEASFQNDVNTRLKLNEFSKNMNRSKRVRLSVSTKQIDSNECSSSTYCSNPSCFCMKEACWTPFLQVSATCGTTSSSTVNAVRNGSR